MSRFVLAPLLAVVLVASSGCATIQIARPGTLPTAAASVPADQRLAAWNRAIGALIDAGFVPQVFNETACYVSAKRRDDILSGAIAIVQVTPEGVVRVQISGIGQFSSQDALNAEITRRQTDILQRIVHPGAVGCRDASAASSRCAQTFAVILRPKAEGSHMVQVLRLPWGPSAASRPQDDSKRKASLGPTSTTLR